MGFFDPRSSAAPLLDALEPLGDRAEVEFLRPAHPGRAAPSGCAIPTGRRCTSSTSTATASTTLSSAWASCSSRTTSTSRTAVNAERLGALLNECGIPLVVLDACQTATPDERNPFGSVAARLIESGVGGVRRHELQRAGRDRPPPHRGFYAQLARGRSVQEALDLARRTLLADTKRLTLHRPGNVEETIHLPGLVRARALPAGRPSCGPSRGNAAPELTTETQRTQSIQGPRRTARPAVPRQPRAAASRPSPQYGFHGRARELLALERAFAGRSIVVLHGFGGQGKTALAAHAAAWLTRTGLFERAAFVSFEQGADLEVSSWPSWATRW